MRRRVGRPKSRTGCITCKLRHIKCGEEKPACLQCTRDGRQCDGYNNASQRQLREKLARSDKVPRVSPDHRVVLGPGSRQERQYVHVFCTQTAKALSGFFTSDLWNQVLPQLSQREPTIRHAVAAVSAAYEHQVNPAGGASGSESFVLQQYNKAIHYFLEHLSTPHHPAFDLLLVTCILFVCLEMLNGNNGRALDHLQGGLQILRRQQQKTTSKRPSGLDQELAQLFSRLNIQLSLFGRPLLLLEIPTEKSTAPSPETALVFDNIAQARECITSLMNRSLAFIRSIGIERIIPPEPIVREQLQQQQGLEQEFYVWEAAFHEMMEKCATRAGISDPRAPLVLQIEYHTSLVWLLNCISREERAYDRHQRHFEAIVDTAEQVVQLSAGPDDQPASPQFCLDAEVVPMVYWTATKCRDPRTRRRAIEVLSRYPGKEGMWAARRYAEVATRVVEFEEAPMSFLPLEQRVPEEHHRVYEALMFFENEVDPNPFPVLLMLKPHGVDGDWVTQFAYVGW